MNFAILLSGGIGMRLGNSRPKQYLEHNGKPIIAFALESLAESELIDEIVVVAADEWIPYIRLQVESIGSNKDVYFAHPGSTRQMSIFNGLKEIMDKHSSISGKDLVIIHDAARPFLTKHLIHSCILIEDEFDGAMPVLPMKDTVYLSDDGEQISKLLDRSSLYAGQAPESFRLKQYFQAHQSLSEEVLQFINGSSELAFKAGMRIKLVKGDPDNFKITDTQDLENFKRLAR